MTAIPALWALTGLFIAAVIVCAIIAFIYWLVALILWPVLWIIKTIAAAISGYDG